MDSTSNRFRPDAASTNPLLDEFLQQPRALMRSNLEPAKPPADAASGSDAGAHSGTARKERYILLEPMFGSSGTDRTNGAAQNQTKSPDGGTWFKQQDGTWKYTDATGTEKHRFASEVTDVAKDAEGSLSISFKDGTKIVQKTDRSELSYDSKQKLIALTYADQSRRQFEWDGDHLKATKTREGTWFDRQKDGDGKYNDSWQTRGSTDAWQGKLEVDAKTGFFSITPSSGDGSGVKTVAKTDLTKESTRPDGSREILFANKASVSFDANGRAIKTIDENGKSREFGYNSEDALSSLTVTVPSANRNEQPTVFKWERKGTDWYCNGEKQNAEITVDKTTGIYRNRDNATNETLMVAPGGNEIRRRPGGLEIEYKNGNPMESRLGDRQFNFERNEKGETTQVIRKNKNSKEATYTYNASSGWVDQAGTVLGAQLEYSDRGEPVFVKGEKRTRIAFDGKYVSQVVDSKTKAVTETSESEIKTRSQSGTERVFTLQAGASAENGGNPVREVRTTGGKTETWIRQKTEDSDTTYSDNWRCQETGKTEKRAELKLSSTGVLTYKLENGTVYRGRADGTEEIAAADNSWRTIRTDGNTTEIKYVDGTVRKFGYDSTKTLNTIDITFNDKSVSHWERMSDGKWKNGDSVTNQTFRVVGDVYEIVDADKANEKTTRTPDGLWRTEKPDKKSLVEWRNDNLIRVSIDGKERTFERDSKGAVTSITDKTSDTVYKLKDDQSWSVQDTAGTEKAEPDFKSERKGQPVIGSDGHITFRSKDDKFILQELGANPRLLDRDSFLTNRIDACTDLSPAQKTAFKADVAAFNAINGLAAAEVKEASEQLIRMLESEKVAIFSNSERARLAVQLAWHVAHPNLDSQGAHPTCNVSDVRVALQRQLPGKFARLIADISIDGTFKTKDGSTIRPPRASLNPSPGESKFPADDGARSWLGRISDVTLTNIHWQRRTKDTSGAACKAGDIRYEEIRPTNQGEGQSRVFKYEERSDGQYRTRLAKAPGLWMPNIVDVFSQVSGNDESGRGMVHSSRPGGDGVTTISSVDELKTALGKGPFPRIVEVQNDVLYNLAQDGYDHEHVVVVLSYDAKNNEVLFDNTHSPTWDRLTPGKGITAERLYAAMSAPTHNSADTETESDGYWAANGIYYRREKGVEKWDGSAWQPVYHAVQQ